MKEHQRRQKIRSRRDGKSQNIIKSEQKYKKGKHRDEKGNTRETSLLEACGSECCQLAL